LTDTSLYSKKLRFNRSGVLIIRSFFLACCLQDLVEQAVEGGGFLGVERIASCHGAGNCQRMLPQGFALGGDADNKTALIGG